jgi:hypothetical protein
MLLPSRRAGSRLRRGLAPLEVVMATAIGVPILVVLLAAGIFACRIVFSLIGVGVGSPLM